MIFHTSKSMSSIIDAPPKLLERLKCKSKTQNNKKQIGVHSLTCNTPRVKGLCWNFEMGSNTSDKRFKYSYERAQTKQQVD
jgi:hypothetical protein